MSALLTNIGLVFTEAMDWVGDVATAITSSPVLELFCVAIPLCGLGVGMFKRLLSARG